MTCSGRAIIWQSAAATWRGGANIWRNNARTCAGLGKTGFSFGSFEREMARGAQK